MEDIFLFLKNDYKKEYSLVVDVNRNLNGGLFYMSAVKVFEESFKKILHINDLVIATTIDPKTNEVKEDRTPHFNTMLNSKSFENLLNTKYNYNINKLRKIIRLEDRHISAHGKRIRKHTTLEELNTIITLDKEKTRSIYIELYFYLVAVYTAEQGKYPSTEWKEDYFEHLYNLDFTEISEQPDENSKKSKSSQVKLDKVKQEYENKLKSNETKLEKTTAELIEKDKALAEQDKALSKKEEQLLEQELLVNEINEQLIQKENENKKYLNEIEKLKSELALPKIEIKKSKKITIKDRKVIERKSIALDTNKSSSQLKNVNLVKVQELSPNLSVQLPLDDTLSIVYDFITNGWYDKAEKELLELEKDYDAGEIKLAQLCLKHKVDSINKLQFVKFDDSDLVSLAKIVFTCSDLTIANKLFSIIVKNLLEHTEVSYALPLYDLILNYNFPDRQEANKNLLELIYAQLAQPNSNQDELLLTINTYAKFLSNSEYNKFIVLIIEKAIENKKFKCAKSLNDTLLTQNKTNALLIKNDLLITLGATTTHEIYSNLFKVDTSEKLQSYISSLSTTVEQLECLNKLYTNLKLYMHTNYTLAQNYFDKFYDFEFSEREVLKEEILTELLSHGEVKEGFIDFTLSLINLYPAEQTEIYVSKLAILASKLFAHTNYADAKDVAKLILEVDTKNSVALEIEVFSDINIKKSLKNIDFENFFDFDKYQTLLSTLSSERVSEVNNKLIEICLTDLVANKNLLSLFNNLLRFEKSDKQVEHHLSHAAALFIEAKKFEEATLYLNKAVAINNLNSRVYWQLCLCDLKCSTLNEAKKSKTDICDNKYYKLALVTSKKANDTASYKLYTSYYTSQLAYRERKKEKAKKTKTLIVIAAVMVLIILFNIFFPIILNKIRYNRAQELKFKEYATYCAVYIEEEFNQKELFIPNTYKDKPIKEIINLNSCDSLEKITLPETITEIRAYAFEDCINLKTILAHKDMKIEVIGISAFENCKNLTNLDFDFSNLNSLGSRAFANCESFTYMDLSQSSLTKVPASCFSLCYALKEVRLPNIISTIDNSAFFKCTSLERFDVPDSISNIEEQAFSFCEKLSILTFSNYSNLFSIGDDAFNGCNIKSLSLPHGVTKLGVRAFANNNISYLDLPQTLEIINTRAFFGNEILTLIINFHNPYIIGSGKNFGEKFGFNDTDSSSDIYIKTNLVVYVPASSYNDFVSAWKNYTVEKKLAPQ